MKKVYKKKDYMCKTRILLDSFKKNPEITGLNSVALNIAESQTEDIEKMQRDITELKESFKEFKNETNNKIDSTNSKIDSLSGKVDLILELQKKPQILNILKNLIECKYFWVLCGLFLLLKFGVKTAGIADILKTLGS